jgi:hypothetical protein
VTFGSPPGTGGLEVPDLYGGVDGT